jgi:hypothetical protein
MGCFTYRRFLELFRHMVGLLGRVISQSQGLYLHRTTQHRKTRTNIHAWSGIRTHDPSNQPAKTHASDRTATVTDHIHSWCDKIRTEAKYACRWPRLRRNIIWFVRPAIVVGGQYTANYCRAPLPEPDFAESARSSAHL